jgi:hypothetical protein
MALVICSKHGNGALFVCPHVVRAMQLGSPCPGIEYRQYSAADDPELEGVELGCWFCAGCRSEHRLPPSGPLDDPDEFLNSKGGLYRPMCPECFDEWKRAAAG